MSAASDSPAAGAAAAVVPAWQKVCVEPLPGIDLKSATNAVAIVSHATMAKHAPLDESTLWQAERPQRLTDTMAELGDSGLLAKCVSVDATEITREQLSAVHDAAYVDAMLALEGAKPDELKAAASRYNTVYMNEHTIAAAKLAAGAVAGAVDAAVSGRVKHAACVVRPPGHHAECGCAMGFSVFNNVAVAAAHAVNTLGLERVLVVDWDVHHGNGTQAMFASDPRVLFFSVHRWDSGVFYPGIIVDSVGAEAGAPTFTGTGKGAGYSMNLAWTGEGMYGAPAMGDGDYKAGFDHLLMPIARAYKPQLILISAGFDAARGDPLGDCDVTPAGYSFMTGQLMALGAPIVLALEGGYNVPSIKHSLAGCVATMLGAVATDGSAFPPPRPLAKAAVNATIDTMAPFWPMLAKMES